MSYFPSFGPFYDPIKEQEVYRENDGSLNVRSRALTPGASVSTARRLEPQAGNDVERIPKIESRWSEHVRLDQADLFYIDVDGKMQARSNSLPQAPAHHQPSSTHPTETDLSGHNGGHHADSTVASSPLQERSFAEEEEKDKLRSSAELRKKSKQLHQVLRKKPEQLKNGDVRGVSQRRKLKSSGEGGGGVSHNNNCTVLSSTAHATNKASNHGPSVGHRHNGASQQENSGPHIKDVLLVPDLSKHTEAASGAELFELLLGIALCRYRQRSAPVGVAVNGDVGDTKGDNKERKLVVQGVVSGSPADKSGSVHRGDMLLYLNGQEVMWSNLDRIVHNIKREVRLTLQVPKIIGPTSCSQTSAVLNGSSRLPAYHNLCLLVTGRDIFNLQQQLLQHSCLAMYLTLSSSNTQEQSAHDDIVYSFPAQEEWLTNIRGLFLTLNSSLQDIVQTGADISSLVVAGEKINVAYHQQGRDIFIMAAPALRIPVCVLRSIVIDVCRMLTTVFGGVDKAFHGGESSQLDQVFALRFHHLLGQARTDNNSAGGENDPSLSSAPPWSQLAIDGMCAAPWLPLSEDNRLICDEILSEFEAGDFDDFLEENELYLRRSYTVLGSALFYKNYLVCSHLQESDLQDVYGFLHGHCLLTLACRQSINQLVVWQEVHLFRRCSSTHNEHTPVGYQEPPARCFMLIVGMNHFLLATLLEAGGCSQQASGRPSPDPLFVDQARATLIQLDTDDIHMSACCQLRLTEAQDSPLTTSAERYVIHSKQSKDDGSGVGKSSVTSKPPSPGRPGGDGGHKYRSSPRSDRRPGTESEGGSDGGSMTRQGSKLSYGSNDSGGSGSSTGAPKPKTGRFSSLLDMSSIGRSMSALHIDTIGAPTSQGKLSRGKDNMLFHFIHYNNLEGIMVTPVDLDLTLSPSSIHSEVMANFHRCVLNMRYEFSQRDAQDTQKSCPTFKGESVCTSDVEEQGVLFHCSIPTSIAAQHVVNCLTYWVVGRRLRSGSVGQELYVCFHESTSQSLVEMAFALAFGS